MSINFERPDLFLHICYMKAMLFAAGLGTRLAPFTDKHPKALAEVQGRTLLEWNVRYLQSFGIREVIVNVHHFADQIVNAIEASNGWGADIQISDERSEVLETGGGLKHASRFLKNEESFLVMNVDVLTDLDLNKLIDSHQSSESFATLAVMKRESSRYLLFNEKMQLSGWKNEKTGQMRGSDGITYAFSGIQVVSNKLLRGIKRDGKFSMIDVYLDAIEDGNVLLGFDHSGGRFLDVGKPESLKLAADLFR